jgi:hypothetical protein
VIQCGGKLLELKSILLRRCVIQVVLIIQPAPCAGVRSVIHAGVKIDDG